MENVVFSAEDYKSKEPSLRCQRQWFVEDVSYIDNIQPVTHCFEITDLLKVNVHTPTFKMSIFNYRSCMILEECHQQRLKIPYLTSCQLHR